MFGLIGGVFTGGFISARIARENTGKILDTLSLSILPLIAAERIAENRIEDFDISRPLDNAFLSKSFLAIPFCPEQTGRKPDDCFSASFRRCFNCY